MNTTKLIIIGIVVIVGAAAWYLLAGPNIMDDATMHDDSMENESTPMEEDDPVMTGEGVSGGSYEAYSPEKLALAEEGDVVLFFRASWCPTCRILDADLRANEANIPAGVTILDVDYDNSTALKQRYGVTYQHTLVQVDDEGNQIAKWSGSPSLSALLSNIQ
jgi:thiol-disulfide isomerase/thioredoxin